MRASLAIALAILLTAPSADAARPGRAPASSAASVFQEATAAHRALNRDEKRRRQRDAWLALVDRYASVAKRFPSSAQAPQALFEAATLCSNLARVSLSKKDLNCAVDNYTQLVKRYPRSRLVPDARLALGRIYRDRLGDSEKALAQFAAAEKMKGSAGAAAGTERRALEKALARSRLTPPPKREAAPAVAAKPAASRGEAHRAETTRDAAPVVAAKPAASKGEALRSETTREAVPVVAAREDDDAAYGGFAALNGEAAQPRPSAGVAVPAAEPAIKRIVVDPGHGGYDSGAVGTTGAMEKDIALAIADELRKRLQTAGMEVVLTRDNDTFLSLEDRTRLANRERGDLFVSIHCNDAPNRDASGAETYFLNVATDQYSQRLANRENASDDPLAKDLRFILKDIATKAVNEDSARLARSVQGRLVADLGIEDRGVKKAGFLVLLTSQMPTILVETGFLSNKAEEALLVAPAYQVRVAAAIAEGIVRYVAASQTVARLY